MPLRGRQIRMSDIEWLMFKELGGAEWLRKYVKKKATLPFAYYERENERLQKRIL